MKPGEGAWANYDFVPGDRGLFFDDHTDDRVGDFPRPFELLAGNGDVVEWQGQRYIRGTTGGTIALALPETLPERFTIEFPASVQHGNASLRVSTDSIDHGSRAFAGSAIAFRSTDAGLFPTRGEGPNTMTTKRDRVRGDVMVTVRVMADGDYMKMYLDDHRVANAPNAVFPREGRVSTQGIYFAVNSDVIRPESTGTLREIGDMLRQHAELRLSIEGHTDSDGDDAFNLDLSQRRAAAVKAHLIEAFDIDDARLETAGLGETKPAADNTTPEGKQQNRRVELVKIGG